MYQNLSLMIHLLGSILGQVITELESAELLDIEERIRNASKARRSGDLTAPGTLKELVSALSVERARVIASAFTVFFDLTNLAEDNDRVQSMQMEEKELYPGLVPGSIGEAVSIIRKSGVSEEKMGSLLKSLSIELVLTAHPTEAKRRTILSKLQRIALILKNLRNPDLPQHQAGELKSDLRAEISALWLTDRVRTISPAVTDEVRTGLYYIGEIFWSLIPGVYENLGRALAVYYPGLSPGPSWLRLASWIGGDRDGNPNVTTAITAETLRLHRGLAVEKHRTAFRDLSRGLTLSLRRLPPGPELLEWIESRRPFSGHAAYIDERYRNEPYRLALSLVSNELGEASHNDMLSELLSEKPPSPHMDPDGLADLLKTIISKLPQSIASRQPVELLRQLEIFSLHAASLHIRDDASRLRAAMGEILRGLSIELNFEGLDDEARLNLLTFLLGSPPRSLQTDRG